jgi:pimeloyl-ACP methyl ester carboxylesterase
MKAHTVNGGGGVKLRVREWGSESGRPILLIHGWSQNLRCWQMQYESAALKDFRLVAFDLRGHGESEAPANIEAYTNGDLWADDVAAIIRELGLKKPVLVGWSYGGFVISDYLRRYGEKQIAGVDFVAAAVVLGPKAFGTLIGPGFLENAPAACDPNPATNHAAIDRFLRDAIVKPIPQKTLDAVREFILTVSPQVRGFLIQRELDFTDVLERLTVPVLLTHGRADIVVLPAMSMHILKHCKSAKASWYDGVGHATFLEDPERFNRELAKLAG